MTSSRFATSPRLLRVLSLPAAALALAAAALGAACTDNDLDLDPLADGGADAASESSTPPGVTTGDAVVRATYAGPARGPLVVALRRDGGELGGLGTHVSPTWPGTTELRITQVPAGTWTVVAWIDQGAPSADAPGAGDPTNGEARTITVVAGQDALSELTLDATGTDRDGGADAAPEAGPDASDAAPDDAAADADADALPPPL